MLCVSLYFFQDKEELEKSGLDLRVQLIELKSSKVRMEKELVELNKAKEMAMR